MTFIVVWAVAAIDELSRIERLAVDPASVHAESVWLDRTLRRYPRDLGESRNPGYRVWFGDAIGAYFFVDEVANRVEVLKLGPARRR